MNHRTNNTASTLSANRFFIIVCHPSSLRLRSHSARSAITITSISVCQAFKRCEVDHIGQIHKKEENKCRRQIWTNYMVWRCFYVDSLAFAGFSFNFIDRADAKLKSLRFFRRLKRAVHGRNNGWTRTTASDGQPGVEFGMAGALTFSQTCGPLPYKQISQLSKKKSPLTFWRHSFYIYIFHLVDNKASIRR